MEEDPYQISSSLNDKRINKKFVWPVIEVKKSVMDGPSCLQIGESMVFIQLQ